MTNNEKANAILLYLSQVIQVDWNCEEVYIKAIETALETFKDNELRR